MRKILARYAVVAFACFLLLAPSVFAAGGSSGSDTKPAQTTTAPDGNGTEEGPTMPHY